MKTRAIPAQITTVEDRIAGNLNLTQIILLMLPVFLSFVVYAVLPQSMHMTLYKIPLIALVTISCMVLALRIKGKVVLHWLVILLKYNTRPTYYLYNKNESYVRDIALPIFKTKQRKLFTKSKVISDTKKQSSISIAGLAQLEGFITNPEFSFSIRTGKKGGLHVALKQK